MNPEPKEVRGLLGGAPRGVCPSKKRRRKSERGPSGMSGWENSCGPRRFCALGLDVELILTTAGELLFASSVKSGRPAAWVFVSRETVKSKKGIIVIVRL